MIGSLIAIAALVGLGQEDGRPGDFATWVQYGLGFTLIAAMVIGSMRLALGEESGARRGVALLAGSLGAGLVGMLLTGLAVAN